LAWRDFADNNGCGLWVGVLQQGIADQHVIAAIIGSAEHLAME
jgi:hypothetical protein